MSQPTRARLVFVSLLLLTFIVGGVAVWSGCLPSSPGETDSDSENALPRISSRASRLARQRVDQDGQTILEQMTAAYRSAKTYADAGEISRVDEAGQVLWKVDYSVAFQRPNKIRLHAYDATAVSDGQKFLAWTRGLEGQVLALTAPSELTEHPFLDEATSDPELYKSLSAGPPPVQLPLLLAKNALQQMFEKGLTPVVLPSAPVEGNLCQRVKVEPAGGLMVFWVDRQSRVLRRLELKVPNPQAGADEPATMNLIADFHGARLNEPLDAEAFAAEAPADAKLVKRLVGMMRPLPPSTLLEQKIGQFTFAGVNGKAATRENLAGKVVVCAFWSVESPPSRDSLTLLQELNKSVSGAEQIAFVCVSTDDPKSISDEQISSTLADWGIKLPAYRDATGAAVNTFGVKFAPTLFVLDRDGVVQDNEVGVNPNLATELSATIKKLIAGKPTAADARARFAQRERDYAQSIAEAQQAGPATAQEIPQATIAPRSEPKNFSRTLAWTAADVKSPGNVLVVQRDEQAPTILVHDRWESIVELSADGKLVERHALGLPERTPVTYFRTATDSRGQRYYVAFASAQQQLYLYDESWKQILSFPSAAEGRHDGTADVQFVDLGNDLELAVGYWGEGLGVQLVSLTGQRKWGDRSPQNVWRVAASGKPGEADRKLLAANARGSLMVFDAEGKAGAEIRVGNHPLTGIVAAKLSSNDAAEVDYLGLTEADGSIVALGMTLDGRQKWSYKLPRGVHKEPLDFVTWGKLANDESSCWILGGADGSIHFVDADGTLVDRFDVGAELTSLAATRVNGQPVLLIGTARGLEAWNMTRK